jgi:hypothetical protein
MILVDCMSRATLGEGPHDTQGATTRGLDRNGGGDAHRNDCTDALSCYGFHERRWSFEMLLDYCNSSCVLNSAVRRSDLLSMNERA